MTAAVAQPMTLALERTDSHPSLTHSTSSDDHLPSHRGVQGAGSEALLTPTTAHPDLSLTRSTSDLVNSPDAYINAFPLSPQDPRGRKGPVEERGRKVEEKGRLWSSKSSSALRSKSKERREKKGRGRSATLSEQAPPPLPPISIPSRSGTSPPQPKSASAFSSFFKKLTGRSNTISKKSAAPPVSTSPKSVPALPVLQAMKSHTSEIGPTASVMVPGHSRQRSRASVSEIQARSPAIQQGPISASAPRMSHVRSPSNLSARSNRSAQNATVSTSPAVKQALPAQAQHTALVEPPETTTASEQDHAGSASSHENVFGAPTAADTEVPNKSPMKRNRASFTLASAAAPAPAPEPEQPEPEEPEEEMEEVDSEAEDEIQDLPSRPPLEPILIPRSSGAGTDPRSATTTTTSEGEVLVTPSSPGTSPSKSPPKYDPIVDSPPKAALGRKESKWRKSLMGLGVAGKPQKQPNRPTRRLSSREPPTSYDAYLVQQKRIASNRQSCQPTIHTASSVAAETRGLSKDDQDAAETFFLS